MDINTLAAKCGQWNDVINFLVRTRYSIRKNGKPIEKSYEDVIARIVKGIIPSKMKHVSPEFRKVFGDFVKSQKTALAKALKERRIIPSTPVLMNFNSLSKHAGTFACYPMIPPKDSLEDILRVAHIMAKVFKYGGGAGVGLSNLRPKGALVDNGQGIASGPASFCVLYAAHASVISQGSKRRGALMAWLYNDHPDWEEFISLKDHLIYDKEGKDVLNSVNISLAIKDSKAFLESEQFNKVAEHAWKTGDPGLLFTDTHLAKTPIPREFDPCHVNPCIVGTTFLLDGNRLRQVRAGGAAYRAWCTGKKPILRLILDNGFELTCTPDHRVLTFGGWVEAKDCKDKLICIRHPARTYTPNPEKADPAIVYVLKDQLEAGTLIDAVSIDLDAFSVALRDYAKKAVKRTENGFILRFGFSGLAKFVQKILGAYGIVSELIQEGDSCALSIVEELSAYYFAKIIGENPPKPSEHPDALAAALVGAKVVDIEYVGVEYVYDFTMNDGQPFNYADGLIIHNCGEYQSVAGTVCNLHTVNLLANWLAENDHEAFLRAVQRSAYLATIFGTFLIYAGDYPEEFFRHKTYLWRPVGVGFTGLHEVLILNDIDYESDEAVEFTRQVQQHLLLGTLKASADMAKVVYSKFEPAEPNYDNMKSETYPEGPPPELPTKLPVIPERMLCSLLEDDSFKEKHSADLAEIQKCLDKWGCLFNSVTTSQMPTGTTSVFGFCGSTGIEPLWALEWERNVRDLDGSFRAFNLKSLVTALKDDIELKPAVEIAPKWQLNIMAVVQDNCHTAVSKTVNLKNSATVEDVISVFKMAAEMGLKSTTIYRDGSRSIQVLKAVDSKDPVSPDDFDVRSGITVRIKGSRTVYVTMNKFGDDKIREVFVITGKAGTAIQGYNEAIGRLISFILQRDASKEVYEGLIKSLSGIDLGEFYQVKGMRARSVPEVVAFVLKEYGLGFMKDMDVDANNVLSQGGDICPECGQATLYRMGGCLCCKNCGFSTC